MDSIRAEERASHRSAPDHSIAGSFRLVQDHLLLSEVSDATAFHVTEQQRTFLSHPHAKINPLAINYCPALRLGTGHIGVELLHDGRIPIVS